MGVANGFTVDATSDPTLFTTLGLRNYDVIYSVNGDFFGNKFSPEQKKAVESHYGSGKGLGCLHQCNRPDAAWAWYKDLMACEYLNHAGIVPADVYADKEGEGNEARGSMMKTGNKFNYTEEWYNPTCSPRGLPGVKILLTVDEKTISGGGGTLGSDHPLAWTRNYKGGRYFMNLGAHTDEFMTNPILKDHVLGSLKYLAGYSGCMDSTYIEYNVKATNQPVGTCITKKSVGVFILDHQRDPVGNINPLNIVVKDPGKHQVRITNAQGKNIYTVSGSGPNSYTPRNLGHGIYYVKVFTSHRNYQKRVIFY
jgi:type 1 glutamine amidotransferase